MNESTVNLKKNKTDTIKEVYEWIKTSALQVFGGLVMDKKDDLWVISMTKTATWIVLFHCLYVWNKVIEVAGDAAAQAATRQDVSQGELYTLWTLLGVGVAKLGAKTISDGIGTIGYYKNSKSNGDS